MSQGERVPGIPITQLEQDYIKGTEAWRQRFGQTAGIMVKTGAAQEGELDFILRVHPEVLPDWVQANPDVQEIMAEFRGSNLWLSRALARAHHITYDTIYRALRHSPIRPYIGDFTVDPRLRPIDGFDNPPRVRVLEPNGPDLSDIRLNYYIEMGFREFNKNADGFLAALERGINIEQDEKRREALTGVRDFYLAVSGLEFPTLHRQLLNRFGQPRKNKAGQPIFYPADHQKVAIVRAAWEKSLAVFDGTGSGKTGIGIGLTEYIGADRALVICPAGVRETWKGKIGEYYIDNPGVITVNGGNGGRVADREKYVVVSYTSLIDRKKRGKIEVDVLSPTARCLLEIPFGLLILDEAHYINSGSKRSDAVLELARRIPRRLILTATPIRNSVDDLARIAHLLEPGEFTTPDALRALGKSAISPLADLLATKTIRRKTEDVLELPPFCPETEGKIAYIQLELNPTQKGVYEAIFEEYSLDSLSKLRLLRLAAIDHHLVRGGKFKLPFDEQQAVRGLQKAFVSWSKRRGKGDQTPFNSDYLVTHGFKHVFLGAHFYYKKGMDQLVQMCGNITIQQAWSGVVEPAKFLALRDLIKQRLARGEKVDVFSGHFVKGVLREVIDDVTGEVITQDLFTYLRREFPDIKIGRIDGQVKTSSTANQDSERERVRRSWQNDPDFKILLTTIPSAALGIDLSIDDGVTKGVCEIGIDLPYTDADLWQKISREYRLGQATPVHVKILEGIGTVDQGIHVLIDRKADVAEQLFDGVSPDDLERQLLDRKRARDFLVDYITSPKRELERKLYIMRGRGVTANGVYLETILPDGKTIGEMIAEAYSRYWEYTYSGHTARLTQQVIQGLRTGREAKFATIVDAGSGPLVLERVIRQESETADGLRIISVDINKHMLESGVTDLQNLGFSVDRNNIIHRPMSDMGISSSISDAVVCSLAFHYSSSTEDRGRILTEANRVLRNDGYYLITLPENYLTLEQYRAFGNALKKFGFALDRNISGKVTALDHKDVPFSVWLIAAKKIGVPVGKGLSMDEFHFSFEEPKVSHYTGDKNQKDEDDRRKEQDRLVKHEQFTILDPENGFKPKGSPKEASTRSGLALDEEMFRRLGWRVERRQKGGKTEIIIRN